MVIKTAVLPQHKDVVTWTNSLSSGIKVIDTQHKGLLDFVNDLFNHSTGNEVEEREHFKQVINTAVQYVKDHFRIEEKLMMTVKFPGYMEHKKLHDEFTLEMVKSVKDFEAGKRLVLEKYAYYLKDWILTHIAVMDKQYFDYFRKIATRKADGTLSISRSEVGA